MVWVGIMMDGRTDLHFFDTGSVTAQIYRYEVLGPYVRLFRGVVGPDFIFMDYNAPCHRAVLIDDFLETENIQRMSWPAYSPDLNPIEHVWDMLGRQIAALSHPPSSVTELKRALQEDWYRLSPQLIHHLIASMPPSTNRRCRQPGIHRVQCIGVGGCHPFWHGRRFCRPRYQPRQVSGGVLTKVPAPGNRSNKTQEIEREGSGNDGGERVGTREKRKAVAKKRWSEKEDTAGRCIVI
ncbi:transposable element Tcb2 transposase [Trichonephila clavipes]|nr:transposable element Tcb2 transposase [Trichonephila clavipes]